MFDNPVLNVVTGLVFIFLIYSLFATAMQEAIANMLQRRANMLQYGIKVMLTKTINNNNHGKIKLAWYYFKKALRKWKDDGASLFRKRPARTMHDQFYNHPIIKNYGQNSWFSKPSYIGPSNFSTVLIDTLKNIDKTKVSAAADFATIKDVLDQFTTEVRLRYDYALNISKKVGVKYAADDQHTADDYEYKKGKYTYRDSGALAYTPDLQKVEPSIPKGAPDTTIMDIPVDENVRVIDKETLQILTHHLNEAAGDLDVFRSRLEKWYDDTMDRVTGWYKKNTHYWLFAIGLFLAFNLNIDTIEISNYLSKNKAAAEQLAKMGEAAVASDKESTYSLKDSVTRAALDSIRKDMQQVNTLLGLGWKDYGRTDPFFVEKLREDGLRFGTWYTLWLPIKTMHLKDTFATVMAAMHRSREDSVNKYRTAYSKIGTFKDSLNKQLSEKNKARLLPMLDSLTKSIGDSTRLIGLIKKSNDSLMRITCYDIAAKQHSRYLKIAYILHSSHPRKLFGFFITAIAIGLGAPFWYDLLNKLVSIRSAGKVSDGANKSNSSAKNENPDG